jgi:uncharacterized protein
MLTLYQAEWCPFSSSVRERLTELGLAFVARPVEPLPRQRDDLDARAGTRDIPVLEADDGALYRGTREIFAYLDTLDPWQHERSHRRRFLEHAAARESDAVGQILARAEEPDDGERPQWRDEDLSVRDNPDAQRYELRLGERELGHAAYRLRGDRIAFTHTEVLPACQGHGLGTRLVAAALDDARSRGLRVRALCPFVADYIERHPELEDLLERR